MTSHLQITEASGHNPRHSRGGYTVTHVRGSHHYLRHPGKQGLVTIPVHGNRDLPTGTLRAILNQAELDVDAFIELLRD